MIKVTKSKNKEETDIAMLEAAMAKEPPPLRTLSLFGDLDEERVQDVCAALLYLKHTAFDGQLPDEEPVAQPIEFFISTWGGDALGMFGIYDLMRMIRETCDIDTPITFNANLFKEVLVANRECSSAVLEVSTEGLARVNFKIDDYDSTYYIVAMQDVD